MRGSSGFRYCELITHIVHCADPVKESTESAENRINYDVFRRCPLRKFCIDLETSVIFGLSFGSSQHVLMKHHSWFVTMGVVGLRGLTPLCTSMITCASRRR